MNCLQFARSIVEESARNDFADKVRKCSWATERYIERKTRNQDWQKTSPEFSRDTGSDILQLVQKSKNGVKLINNLDFAGDGALCEWVWVIDLDINTLEGFRGFNNQPLKPEERFYFLQRDDEKLYPAKLIAKWQLNNLPSDNKFLAAFKE